MEAKVRSEKVLAGEDESANIATDLEIVDKGLLMNSPDFNRLIMRCRGYQLAVRREDHCSDTG